MRTKFSFFIDDEDLAQAIKTQAWRHHLSLGDLFAAAARVEVKRLARTEPAPYDGLKPGRPLPRPRKR